MRILIMSDSHGRDDLVLDVYQYEMKQNKINTVLHMGDVGQGYQNLINRMQCQVVMVAGNTDYGVKLPQSAVVQLGNHKAFMAHGHRHIMFDTTTLEYAALENNCDIAMYGHTHIPEINQKSDILVLNPGSIAKPRQRDKNKTYIIMTVDDVTGEIETELKVWTDTD